MICNPNLGRKIVVSGTYGVGKTTTTKELARQTGIPTAVARGMREILPVTFPDKTLEQCSPFEIVQLGLTRFAERSALEASKHFGYISDGSALHEWAYGHGRKAVGANGPESIITDPGYSFAIDVFGDVVRRYSSKEYTDVVHLPVEFPLPQDGHRPVSEDFRNHADKLILDTWQKLGKKVHVIGGPSVESRVDKIIDELRLERSPTLDGPSINADGQLWYHQIEDALGPREGRYFSNGFRKSHHLIRDIKVNPKAGEISARVTLLTPSDWSTKNGAACARHFTSIDAILVMGQLMQTLMYSQDSITRAQSNNLWLRDLSITPGRKPIENLDDIPVEIRQTKNKILRDTWHVAEADAYIGEPQTGFTSKVSVCYELPSKEL